MNLKILFTSSVLCAFGCFIYFAYFSYVDLSKQYDEFNPESVTITGLPIQSHQSYIKGLARYGHGGNSYRNFPLKNSFEEIPTNAECRYDLQRDTYAGFTCAWKDTDGLIAVASDITWYLPSETSVIIKNVFFKQWRYNMARGQLFATKKAFISTYLKNGFIPSLVLSFLSWCAFWLLIGISYLFIPRKKETEKT